MATISSREAARLIWNSNGLVFGCRFIKRTTGEIRNGNFRLGPTVKKGLKGGDLPYSPSEHGLIPVFRMASDKSESDGDRRMIPIDGIEELRINGETYSVVE